MNTNWFDRKEKKKKLFNKVIGYCNGHSRQYVRLTVFDFTTQFAHNKYIH